MEQCAIAAEVKARTANQEDAKKTLEKIKRLEQKKGRCLDAYLDGLMEKDELKKKESKLSNSISQNCGK